MSFTTLLVANRGEIARRIIRSAHDMGIRCVAVYVDADADAPFVLDADEAVRLETAYLDAAAILEAARATGAGAVHPGYGFLSENADFAAQVSAAGMVWVGPSPEAIEQMGDKIAAKALAEKAQVPTLPGSEDPGAASSVGYPLLVKAAAGGGGKGMRIVESADSLEESLAAARREAKSGFGDDRVFLERYVARARHIEIQILGDAHGSVVHLGERECSIQRRHQKILEESPSPRVDDALRGAMGDAALRLARELGYQSAGTVEFLLDDDSGEFFFLEVNTRLQVEHPVTELVTGIDLVREQLRVAAGEPLGYEQHDIRFDGSAIEARLYAEDPTNEFLPRGGVAVLMAWLLFQVVLRATTTGPGRPPPIAVRRLRPLAVRRLRPLAVRRLRPPRRPATKTPRRPATKTPRRPATKTPRRPATKTDTAGHGGTTAGPSWFVYRPADA